MIFPTYLLTKRELTQSKSSRYILNKNKDILQAVLVLSLFLPLLY